MARRRALSRTHYVSVVDRLKDMIISGGENVYSAEVENALADHPQVSAVAVIGVPDARWGERVHAVIFPKKGERPDPAALQQHVRGLIAGHKIPRSFQFVSEFPLLAAGKVLKGALRDRASTSGSVST